MAGVNINTVVPDFKFFLNFNVVSPTKLKLLGFLIGPFFPSFELSPLGGCHNCFGNGRFSSVRVFKSARKCGIVPKPCLKEAVAGKKILDKRSLFLEAVIAPGEIGRFKVYGVHVNPAKPVILRNGCLAADAPLVNASFFAYLAGRRLPIVPCHQAVAPDALPTIAPSSPFEVPSTGGITVQISGSARGTRELAVYQGPESSCAPNSQAQNLTTGYHWLAHVHGHFVETFQSNPSYATQPGIFCIYLQAGTGTYLGAPYGRVTAVESVPFLAGDTVGISGPSSTAGFTSITDSFAGTATTAGETLWTYESYLPCGGTAQVEAQQALAGGNFPLGVGSFSKPIASFSSPTFPSNSFYQCAYLQLGAPANGIPTGQTLAVASYLVTVTDAVSIGGPSHTAPGTSVTDTFSGSVISPGEYLWSFDAYAPCDPTAQAENGEPFTTVWAGNGGQAVAQGTFSLMIPSFHDATHPSTSFYRCAYLQSGPPDGLGNPTGSTLATASYFISVP